MSVEVEQRVTSTPGTARQKVPELFAPQLELCDRLRDYVWNNRPTRQEVDSEARAVLTAILRRSIDTYDGAVLLVPRGHPTPGADARSIAI
jgi:hypothetical protein